MNSISITRVTAVTLSIALAASLVLLAGCGRNDDTTPGRSPQPGMTEPDPANAGAQHETVGTLVSIDTAGQRVVIDHEPVEALGWPSMTMGFGIQDADLLEGLVEGEHVRFRFEEAAAGNFVVTRIEAADH